MYLFNTHSLDFLSLHMAQTLFCLIVHYQHLILYNLSSLDAGQAYCGFLFLQQIKYSKNRGGFGNQTFI